TRSHDDVISALADFAGELLQPRRVAVGPDVIDADVAAVDQAVLDQALLETLELARIEHGGAGGSEINNPRQTARALLCERGARSKHHPSACQRDEIPPPHSITSSARAMSVGEMVRPSMLAVLRLITNSSLTGCSTGRSPGRAPLKMRSISPAAR